MWNGAFTAQSNTIRVAVTASASASVALPGRGESVRIVNEGPNHAYVSIGPGAQTATVPTGTPLPTATVVLSGSDTTFSLPDVAGLQISAICAAAGTATLDVQVGMGV